MNNEMEGIMIFEVILKWPVNICQENLNRTKLVKFSYQTMWGTGTSLDQRNNIHVVVQAPTWQLRSRGFKPDQAKPKVSLCLNLLFCFRRTCSTVVAFNISQGRNFKIVVFGHAQTFWMIYISDWDELEWMLAATNYEKIVTGSPVWAYMRHFLLESVTRF